LELIEVSNFTIHRNAETDTKPKTKASFLYQNTYYNNMSVTDPQYYDKPNGFVLRRAALVMSLPDDPFAGKYYKFAAQIFPIPT
jgi:hypothetical protein